MDQLPNVDSDTTASTAVGALVIVLAVVSVALRFYTRYFTGAGFKWDDWLILLALATTIVTDVLVLYSTAVDPNGPAVASDTDPNYHYTPADITYTKLNFIASVLYFTITSSTKLSILFMYNRIFSPSAAFRLQVLAVGFLVVAFWVGCTIANLLNCMPLEYTWINSLDDPRYCFNYNIFWMASGVVEAVVDVLIIAMPVRVIFGLQLNLTKKIALAAVFFLGVFVIVTGVVKVALSYAPGSREPSFNRTEVWTTVHIGIGIVCACLPVCWPLVVRVSKMRPASFQRRWQKVKVWHKVKTRSLTTKSSLRGDVNTTTILETGTGGDTEYLSLGTLDSIPDLERNISHGTEDLLLEHLSSRETVISR